MKLKNIRISPIKKKRDMKKVSKNRKKLSSRRKKSLSPKKIPRKKVLSSSKKKSNLYCGNNRLDPSILNGTKIIGTRNRCLRLGFGAGLKSATQKIGQKTRASRIICSFLREADGRV